MSFDRFAHHYCWMESLLAGGLLQRCRVAWLPSVPEPRRVLLAGEGPGRFLEAAGQAWEGATFVVIDASLAMLAAARRRWVERGMDPGRVEWVHGRLPEAPPPRGPFDLVITHFFLDCFAPDQLRSVVDCLSRVASAKADWLLADFQVADRGWRRFRSQLIVAAMYWFFRRAAGVAARAIHRPDADLQCHGFELRGRRIVDFGLLRTDWWQRGGADVEVGLMDRRTG